MGSPQEASAFPKLTALYPFPVALQGLFSKFHSLSEEAAETHPRRNELQQAVGGQPDVEPGIYSATLKPGDFVIVCSDGLSNHVKNVQFRQFLHGDDGVSADRAARRLMNLVNIEGATDNATVVIVRAT